MPRSLRTKVSFGSPLVKAGFYFATAMITIGGAVIAPHATNQAVKIVLTCLYLALLYGRLDFDSWGEYVHWLRVTLLLPQDDNERGDKNGMDKEIDFDCMTGM